MSKHNVNGTAFTFPDTPEQLVMFERLHGRSPEETLKRAASVRPVRTRNVPLRAPKTPKPGNGVFTPKPGEPGSTVRVWLTEDLYRDGCVMFSAPGAGRVWVSLWDGAMPVRVCLKPDKKSGWRD